MKDKLKHVYNPSPTTGFNGTVLNDSNYNSIIDFMNYKGQSNAVFDSNGKLGDFIQVDENTTATVSRSNGRIEFIEVSSRMVADNAPIYNIDGEFFGNSVISHIVPLQTEFVIRDPYETLPENQVLDPGSYNIGADYKTIQFGNTPVPRSYFIVDGLQYDIKTQYVFNWDTQGRLIQVVVTDVD